MKWEEMRRNEKSPPVDPAGTMTLGPKQLALFLSKCNVGYSVVLLVICFLISLFLLSGYLLLSLSQKDLH